MRRCRAEVLAKAHNAGMHHLFISLARWFCILTALAWAATGVAQPLLVTVDDNNPPFMYTRNGQATGAYPAIVRIAFARMGVPVTLEAKPWARALAELDRGQAAVAGIYRTEERAQRSDFSDPLLTENIAVFVRNPQGYKFTGIADLAGKTVGTVRGWSYGDAFDSARKRGLFIAEDTRSDQQNFEKLANGRLDAVLAIEEAGLAIVQASRASTTGPLKPYLASNPAHVAFPKGSGNAALLPRLNKAIADMKKDGELDRLLMEELTR